MKLRIFAVWALSALATLAFASIASATTLEKNGVRQTGAVTIEASVESGNSILLSDTSGIVANTCTVSLVKGTSSVFTGTAVSGPISTLSWSSCTEGNPTVDSAGTLSVEWIKETTGTVRSNGAKVTVPSIFGNLTCTTSNTDLGTVSGVSTGSAPMALNAVLSCSVIGTARWQGTYVVTGPQGLGVTS